MRRIWNALNARFRPKFPPSPAKARHGEYSMVYSVDDEGGSPSRRLLDLAVKSIQQAADTDLGALAAVEPFSQVWPGEHYRLLSALVSQLQPQLVVEIGTAKGVSALAMKKFLPADGKLVTFDLIPWNDFADTALKAEDFNDGKLSQILDDLGDDAAFSRHSALLAQADLIFVDAPKDGVFEPAFFRSLSRVQFQKPVLIMVDDIRLWNMLKLWRGIDRPKLDLTSFGHWSGTGWIDWTAPATPRA